MNVQNILQKIQPEKYYSAHSLFEKKIFGIYTSYTGFLKFIKRDLNNKNYLNIKVHKIDNTIRYYILGEDIINYIKWGLYLEN